MDTYALPTHAGRTIRVVCPNAAVDRLEVLDAFSVGAVNRSRRTVTLAGGKGMIAARALRRLGQAVSLYGFVGGPTGSLLREECRAYVIDDRHTEIVGETRVTTVIVEQAASRSTVLNERGPHVPEEDQERLVAALVEDCRPADLVALVGSLPAGVPSTFYQRLVGLVRERGALAAVDSSGAALIEAESAQPWLLKTNLDEFAELAGKEVREDQAALVRSMLRVVGSGVAVVVVTLGEAGLVAATADRIVRVRHGTSGTVNATGSGDMVLAGLLAGLSRGEPLTDALRLAAAAAIANARRLEPVLGADFDPASFAEELTVEVTGSQAYLATPES